ncbi:hypothetical protein FBU30_007524 [Linnemannia zychae]|nr:hypothetical protein FBU30_007524 [Linnemannia zychae]
MPPNLIRSCMVSAYNGTKIIFFGGNTVSTISVATIYILDVTTMTWKQGPDADASQARSSMACGVSGDNFVAWGGLQWQPGEASNLPVSNTPIIFNMHTNQWTTKFVRGNRTETQTPDKVDKNNTAAIAGGVAGAIVVIAGALLLIFRKRRQKSQKQKQDNQQHDEHSDTYKLNTYHNQNYYTPPPVPVLAPAPVSMPIPAPVHNNAIINDNNQIYSNYLQSAQLVSTTPNTNGQIYGVYAPTNIQEEKPVTYTQAVPMPIENSQTFVPHGLNVWTGEPSKNPQTLPRPQATINTTTTTVSSPLTMPSSPSTASSRDDYIKHIQHELLMQQTQATAPNNPQYIPARYIQDSNMPARAPQGSGVPISPSLSTSVAGPQAVPLHATTNQELQDQIQQMQAELNRRQWS